MTRRLPCLHLQGAVCMALLTSCVAVEGFDPVGDVASVSGAWRIDSADAQSSNCETLGADRVRLTFLDGQRPVTHSGLFFRCDEGSFTTVAAAGAVIGEGRWTIRLDAIDSSGELVATGPCQEVDVSGACPGGEPSLVTATEANFLTATISAGFRIASLEPDQDRCDAAGISTVALVFEDLGGGSLAPTTQDCGARQSAGCSSSDGGLSPDGGTPTSPTSSEEPCPAGFVGARVAPGHTYRVRVRALDASGATLRESEAQDVAVTAGSHTQLDASGAIELGP